MSGGHDRFSKGDDFTNSNNMDSSSHISGSLNRQSLAGGGDNVFDPLGLATKTPAEQKPAFSSGGLFSNKLKEEKQIISPPEVQQPAQMPQ